MNTRRLLPGASYDKLAQDLENLSIEAANVHGGAAGRSPADILDSYRRWVGNSEHLLRHQLRPQDLSELIHTEHYWAILGMSPINVGLPALIFFEVDTRSRQFSSLAGVLQVERDRWKTREVIVVPDTNVLLHNRDIFDQVDWRAVARTKAQPSLVIPLVIVDELDRLKRNGKDDTRTRARHTLRALNRLLEGDPTQGTRLADDPRSTRLDVLVDDIDHQRLASADAEVVDRALFLKEVSGRPVRLISDDLGMRLRARMADIETFSSTTEL